MAKQQHEEAKVEARGPGAALRAARESAGLTIEQVADNLHLLQSVVAALEKDCYERIRGETFVRGYLRNYARLLGLDDAEVLARYQSSRSAQGAEPRAVSRRRPPARGAAGVGRLGVVLVLLGVSAVFLFQNRAPRAAVAEPAAAAVTIDTANGPQVVPLIAPAAPAAQP